MINFFITLGLFGIGVYVFLLIFVPMIFVAVVAIIALLNYLHDLIN